MRGTPCRAIALVPVSDVIPWEAAPRPPPHCLLTLSLCPAVGGGVTRENGFSGLLGCVPSGYPLSVSEMRVREVGSFPPRMNQLCDPSLVPARAPPSRREWGAVALLGKSPRPHQNPG